MNRRLLIIVLPLLLFLNGCGFSSGRIELFNSFGNFFNSTPESVRVRRGDTLYSISRKYDVPIREMIERNNLRPPYTLKIGQILRLPTAKYHIVAKGDTLYNISKRYDVEMSSVSRLNNLSAPYALRIGQKLVLPGQVVASSYQPASYSAPAKTAAPAKKTNTKAASTRKTLPKQNTKPVKYVAPSKYRKSKFDWPVKGKVISNFGTIGKGRNNDGINIQAALGTAVKAADAGTVAYAGNELKGFGNLILIRHNDGWITAYAHNDRILVKKGQKVRKGEKISTVGSTGGVNSPQLHFEIRCGKKALNPLGYLK